METQRKANKNIYKKHVEYQQSRVKIIKYYTYSVKKYSNFSATRRI